MNLVDTIYNVSTGCRTVDFTLWQAVDTQLKHETNEDYHIRESVYAYCRVQNTIPGKSTHCRNLCKMTVCNTNTLLNNKLLQISHLFQIFSLRSDYEHD